MLSIIKTNTNTDLLMVVICHLLILKNDTENFFDNF